MNRFKIIKRLARGGWFIPRTETKGYLLVGPRRHDSIARLTVPTVEAIMKEIGATLLASPHRQAEKWLKDRRNGTESQNES